MLIFFFAKILFYKCKICKIDRDLRQLVRVFEIGLENKLGIYLLISP